MNTRKQYMNKECTHQEYYEEIGKEAGVVIPDDVMNHVRKSTDEHLNDIPLYIWDRTAGWFKHQIAIAKQKRGDFWSLAGGVCVVKAMARMQKQGTEAESV